MVAVLESHAEAEEAVKSLQKNGIDLKKCSIVGKENLTGEHVTGYYFSGDRISYWGKLGAFWGGLWGLVGGSGYFLIPGVGAVLVAGSLVAAIVGALEGAVVVGGLSALGAGFYNIGIPKDSVVEYETAVKGDRFVVVVHGNSAEVSKAKGILESVAVDENNVQTVQVGPLPIKIL
ncbi:MAG: permease [Candidatus Riflebacteria bacterium]|nr:permease [Candidatus Riflebacteria bacterium]